MPSLDADGSSAAAVMLCQPLLFALVMAASVPARLRDEPLRALLPLPLWLQL